MRRTRSESILICYAGLIVLLFSSQLCGAMELSSELASRLANLPEDRSLPVVLLFEEQVDFNRFGEGRESARHLIPAMQALTGRSQARVREFLFTRGITRPRSFWINNSLVFAARTTLIRDLLALEVPAVIYDATVPAMAPEPLDRPWDRTPLWNVVRVRAHEVWDVYGLDGSGVVVGSVDSGVDVDHPALEGKWRGGDNSWFDAISGLPDPYDDVGHGTHTVGTVLGGDGPGPFQYDIGLAYGAQFIAAKVFDHTGHPEDISQMFAGMQWMSDPDGDPDTDDFPHVVNNSWVWGYGDPIFSGILLYWRQVGIIPVFSIGNGGPAPYTTQPPGDYYMTFGVGATTSEDEVTIFSARGPSPEGLSWPPDGRKPDLVAPGQAVSSCLPGGGYGAGDGTSMAAPHVAGAVALLLDAEAALDFDALRSVLLETAVDIDEPGYDYNAGYGRLDVFAAVSRVLGGTASPETEVVRLDLRVAPNPFRDRVELLFAGPGDSDLELEIFDIRGRSVRTHRGRVSAAWTWDGTDARGQRLAAGLYLLRLSDGKDMLSRRLLLLR